MGPFQVMSKGLGTYHLDLPPRVAAVHPWFYTSIPTLARSRSAGPSALEDECYELEAILQINKRGTHAN